MCNTTTSPMSGCAGVFRSQTARAEPLMRGVRCGRHVRPSRCAERHAVGATAIADAQRYNLPASRSRRSFGTPFRPQRTSGFARAAAALRARGRRDHAIAWEFSVTDKTIAKAITL